MKTPWKSTGAGAALIVLLTVVAYIPTIRGGFVFDDHGLILDNRMVKAGDGLYRFWFTAESPDYYPLTWSLWWLEWRLWDGKAMGYHAVNVLLHAVNAVLVWLILRRLKIPGAWPAAVVFAIHPVNAATVAWISEQKNTLSMFFYALAILLYLRFDEAGRWRWYGLSLAAFLLALLSKTAVVMLPVVLLGCVWWRHGRVHRRDWLFSVPYFVASLAMAVVTVVQHQRGLGGAVVRTGGFAARLAGAGWMPWFYLYKVLLPVDLMMIYPKWEIDASRSVSYLPGTILIGCLVVFWWQRKTWGRPLLFGLGYFVVTLFPVLGFFDQYFYRYSLVADHWQYYSIIGVIALVAAVGERIDRRVGQSRYGNVLAPLGAGLVGATVLMVLGVATWERGNVYADEATLWRDNVRKNPGSWVAQNNLAVALEQAGRIPEAIERYEEALQIRPDYAGAHYNLGKALTRLGRVQEAIRHYQQALKIKPDFAEAHNNWGLILRNTGKTQEAIQHFEQALKIDPDSDDAHSNLGLVLWETGKTQQAIEHFEQALKIAPDSAKAHNNLGIVMARLGNLPEAVEHFEQALRIDPGYVDAHYDLGVALEQLGRVREAMGHYQQALRLRPNDARAHNHLGLALWQEGDASAAIEHWENALQLKPDFAEAHNNLGLALEHLGRVPEAIEHYEQALRLKQDFAEAQKNLTRVRGVH